MTTVDLTADNFAATVKSSPTVLIDFWAEWCGPCKQFGPVYDQVSESNPDIVFGKVDTDAQQELARSFNISAIPTLVAIRDGIVLHSQPGALNKAALENLIRAISEVDMNVVRASQQQT